MKTFVMPDGEKVKKDFPDFKTPWNHDTNFESDRVALFCNDPSLTKQEFKEDADINVILARVLKTGEMPITLPEHFADLTDRTDYFTMASQVAEANALFYELPANKRALFLNDPTRWADAVVKATQDGDRQELIALGIDVPRERPQVVEPEGGAPEGTPAREVLRAAPEAPTSGAPAGDTTQPKTDTPKK